MNETDITILSLSEAGRAALAMLADVVALCEQQTRTIALTSERAVKAEKDLAVARELLELRTALLDACRRNLDAARDDHDADAARMKEERDAATARAEKAEELVMRLAEALEDLADDWEQGACDCCEVDCRAHENPLLVAARAALADTADIASRWVPLDEHADAVRAVISRQERIEALEAERDAAIAAKEAAESREHALGVQVEALRERVRLLSEGADILRDISDDTRAVPAGFEDHYLIEKATIDIGVGCFLAKVDAVPGDVLATP